MAKYNFFTGEYEEEVNNFTPVQNSRPSSVASFAGLPVDFFTDSSQSSPLLFTDQSSWASANKPGLTDNMNMGDWMSAGQAGAGALQNLYSIYQGEKMLDLAKDQFGFNRRLAKTNLFNQAQTVNAELSDRQRMRNSMGVGLSTEDYMKKYGVRGKM